MSSQPYVTGPANIFVWAKATTSWVFLGFTTGGVSMRFVSAEKDVQSDFAGSELPADVQWMGEQGYLSATLNRFLMSTYQLVKGRRISPTSLAAITPGTVEQRAIGSLMIAQGYAYPLLILFPYAQQAFQSATMIKGYEFSCVYAQQEIEEPVSVDVSAPRLMFRAINPINPVTMSGSLYTNTPSGNTSDWVTTPPTAS